MLSDYFTGVVVKRLSMVETAPRGKGSNQHEFNSSKALKELLGNADRKEIPVRFIWLGEEQEGVAEDGIISWYDSRKAHPKRSEFRLYYQGNAVTELMRKDDAFFLAMRTDNTGLAIIAPASSTVENQLLYLFGLDEELQEDFFYKPVAGNEDMRMDFAARYILDELGVEFEEPESVLLDELVAPFGLKFPKTQPFSELARKSLPQVDPRDNPDAALMAWIEREEMMFRRLERKIVSERLKEGFIAKNKADVDGFIDFSLSVQNRRKSRVGQSLEHHLKALFTACKVRFSHGAVTEAGNKPDFLFPGIAEYHDSDFDRAKLTMLGAKSTLKDRWRQVLPEADKIQTKHVLTLQPSISTKQTTQMEGVGVRLVIPLAIHASYKPTQQSWLMNVTEFVKLVASRQ
ncbi:type II restriction endonuclease [Mesorhizobium sp. NPDC059025]|uniref:type II restriction endonuclease n=1 Tax=unclassified Mesorhizobium TaxID=325217 RepID=UPI0036833214